MQWPGIWQYLLFSLLLELLVALLILCQIAVPQSHLQAPQKSLVTRYTTTARLSITARHTLQWLLNLNLALKPESGHRRSSCRQRYRGEAIRATTILVPMSFGQQTLSLTSAAVSSCLFFISRFMPAAARLASAALAVATSSLAAASLLAALRSATSEGSAKASSKMSPPSSGACRAMSNSRFSSSLMSFSILSRLQQQNGCVDCDSISALEGYFAAISVWSLLGRVMSHDRRTYMSTAATDITSARCSGRKNEDRWQHQILQVSYMPTGIDFLLFFCK